MKLYLTSLGVGVLVGVIYALLQVRSPAPPVVALVGLLGILLGEQLVPLAKRVAHREPQTAQWLRQDCLPRVTGCPPQGVPPAEPTSGPEQGPPSPG